MPAFPPMPPPHATPVVPNILRGVLTDRHGNNIESDVGVIAVNETHAGNRRVPIRTNGEILINVANISSGVAGDTVRLQCIDNKGNGEVWRVSVGCGATNISRMVHAMNPIVDRRVDSFLARSVVR